MKKLITLLALLIALAMIFTACGENGGDSSISESSKPSESQTSDVEGEVFVISSWLDTYVPHQALNPTQDLQVQRIAEAEELYNVKVEYKVRPIAGYRDTFIAATLAGDKWCDLFLANRNMLPALAKNNIITALDEYVDFNSGVLDNEYRDIAAWAGKRYGFAWEYVYAGLGIFYNMDIFENEGMEDPYDIMMRGEWTFDKFREIAIALTKDKSRDGNTDQWGIGNGFTELANSLLIANMGDYAELEDGSFIFGLNTPHAIEAIQFAYDLYHTDGVVKPMLEYDAFATGEAAMTTHVSWAGGMYKDMGMENLGFIFLPKGPNADDYTSGVSGGKFYSVPTTVSDPEKAAKIGLHIYGVWDESIDGYISFEEMSYDGAEAQMFNQRDMDTFFDMQKKQRFVYTTVFEELSNIILNDAFFPLQDREMTPAQAIEAIRLRAQSAIDNVGAVE